MNSIYRRYFTQLWLLSLIAIMISGPPVSATNPAPAPPTQRAAAFVDLRTGNVTILGAFTNCISVVNAPADSNNDGFFETVLRITVDSNGAGTCRATKACFLLNYEGTPCGDTVNIGDSATNDGRGGDGGTQERDAELEIVNQQLRVYRSDIGGSGRLSNHTLALDDGGLKICVEDESVQWGNPRSQLSDSGLFALNGQADTGGANFDIFAGFNRVISGAPGNGRVGSGLASVLIFLEP